MRLWCLPILVSLSCAEGKLDDVVEVFLDTAAEGVQRDSGGAAGETGLQDTGGDLDSDGDGVAAPEDCDDDSPDVHPGADELCDGIDNDCDGLVDAADDGLLDGTPYLPDADGDGHGADVEPVLACEPAEGSVADEGSSRDCDDTDPLTHPGAEEPCDEPSDRNCDGMLSYADMDGDGWAACEECDDTDPLTRPDGVEICNGYDDDCDGLIDEEDDSLDLGSRQIFYEDVDGDGFGAEERSVLACEAPEGHVAAGAAGFDCDDTDAAYHPGAAESCEDPEDYNCDGSVAYADEDGDGWAACEECDDADEAIHPEGEEICNGLDDDCDGLVDDDDPEVDYSTGTTWYGDGDGDGYGHPDESLVQCELPAGHVGMAGDCDDTDPLISPAGSEVCNGFDDDCDGLIDDGDETLDPTSATPWYLDGDGDGWGGGSPTITCALDGGVTAGGDCDDTVASVNPGAAEICDGQDNDCDGSTDEGFTPLSYSTWESGSGCSGRGIWGARIDMCGCPEVTLSGSFTDHTDGSDGQVAGLSLDSTSASSTWDDCSSGCDCDLDISTRTSWSASRSGGTLTVRVSNEITGYEAGNSLSAGFTISDYGSSHGDGTWSFDYTCAD